MSSRIEWRWLGRVPLADCVAIQEARRRLVLSREAGAEVVLLAEHEPTVSLGRSADLEHVLLSPEELERSGVTLERVSRGGNVTYHGPGQLMVYPIVRLRAGLVPYLETVAASLAQVAAELGVPGAVWRRDPAGLWLGKAKLAACGVHLHRRVTTHGFALDVATPASAWQMINPCGLAGVTTTSIAVERRACGLGAPPSVATVAEIAGPILCRNLDRLLRAGLTSAHHAAEPMRL